MLFASHHLSPALQLSSLPTHLPPPPICCSSSNTRRNGRLCMCLLQERLKEIIARGEERGRWRTMDRDVQLFNVCNICLILYLPRTLSLLSLPPSYLTESTYCCAAVTFLPSLLTLTGPRYTSPTNNSHRSTESMVRRCWR